MCRVPKQLHIDRNNRFLGWLAESWRNAFRTTE